MIVNSQQRMVMPLRTIGDFSVLAAATLVSLGSLLAQYPLISFASAALSFLAVIIRVSWEWHKRSDRVRIRRLKEENRELRRSLEERE
jgi:hypothetical protein